MTMSSKEGLEKDLIKLLKSLSPAQQKQFLKSLTKKEAEYLYSYWQLWARADQLPPEFSEWTIWLILGGRGAGKTRAGSEWVRAQAAKGAVRIALIGETYMSVRSVMVEGASGILSVSPNTQRPVFNSSLRQLRWKSGAVAELFSANDPDALRGPQFHFAWSDELCKWQYAQKTWDMLQFTLRLGKKPCQVITTTPRPMKLLKAIMRSPDTTITKSSTYANRSNLSKNFFDKIIKNYEGTQLGRQELEAEIIEDSTDALWSRELVEDLRVRVAPENLVRIVVAIDPPATGNKNSAACGIVAAGIDENKHIYVLGDYSAQGLSPIQWAQKALGAFRAHNGDRMIAEVNQGGDMVEQVIRQLAPQISFRAVRAIHGKKHRAEPIAALYEQGRVHHCGNFKHLEDEMCGWTGQGNEASPDRLDALVWALTDLAFGTTSNARLRPILHS